MLGEMNKINGELTRCGKVAYVAQQVNKNILFLIFITIHIFF